ncbi:MAG: hypothetical protein E3J21_14525 [Anaerolineales bacterium]|nr:MAG: hypothetical protein E3J21_14525 [Anaerolineales bacterium]
MGCSCLVKAKSRYAPATTIPSDKESYQRQIEATHRQIDALVYELYRLTEEEIAVMGVGNH